jgi:hypothetical protein
MTKEELEKEAEEYVKETYCSKCWQKEADVEYACTGLDYCGRYKDFQKGAEPREKRIEELEKENAELKADFIKSCKVKEQALERKDKQLTKAKEIIKSLISTLEIIDGEQIYELGEVKEAERFLNGEVEK